MATPPPKQHLTRINAPLNFRHTDTLITTKVPHYPTKLTTGVDFVITTGRDKKLDAPYCPNFV